MSQEAVELLNLPQISHMQRCKRVLSMDEFDQFNQDDIGIFFDHDAYLKEKRRRQVEKKFVLSDQGMFSSKQ
jgi:hypothetical protein